MVAEEMIKISEWLKRGYQPAIETYLSTEKEAARILARTKIIMAISIFDVRRENLASKTDFVNQSIASMPADKQVRRTLLNS